MGTFLVWEAFEEEDTILPVFITSRSDLANRFCLVRNATASQGGNAQNYRVTQLPPFLSEAETEAFISGECYVVTLSFDGEYFGCRRATAWEVETNALACDPLPNFLCNQATNLKPAIELYMLTADYFEAIGLAWKRLRDLQSKHSKTFGAFADDVLHWNEEGSPTGDYREYLQQMNAS